MNTKDPMAINHVTSQDDMDLKALDSDAMKLAEMGYTQDLKRNYTVLSVLGVGFSLTNSWFGISAALVTGINSGGPVLIVYGIILIALVSTCVGISLSELASAYPNAGGQYFWANELAPTRYANFASYLTGWFAWAGSIFTSAAVAVAVGSAGVGCWQLAHPDFVIEPWHVFVGYQVVNIFAFFFNCYGGILPAMGQLAFWTSLVSFLVILITVPAKAPTHQNAKFVFANFVNNTGWSQNGIAFIVGLINTNWAFACLDCATHLSEEIARPEKMIPVAILGTVAIGFATSWTYSVALFFSMKDVDGLVATSTKVPILALFYQAIGSKGGAIALEALIMVTGIGCQISCHTWQSRLAWSFARDGGIPFSSYFSQVDRQLNVPIRAHFLSCVIVTIVGCLYLASYTAFNSFILVFFLTNSRQDSARVATTKQRFSAPERMQPQHQATKRMSMTHKPTVTTFSFALGSNDKVDRPASAPLDATHHEQPPEPALRPTSRVHTKRGVVCGRFHQDSKEPIMAPEVAIVTGTKASPSAPL
ncbi:MAG: hypothetical protein Q9186_006439 [Xanthomendoza sp. 1 TL-2023]